VNPGAANSRPEFPAAAWRPSGKAASRHLSCEKTVTLSHQLATHCELVTCLATPNS
jgi:hypothetical protein